MSEQQQQQAPRARKAAAPWEQQHVSSVKVSGRVREVVPLSFRELHIVLDCSPAANLKTNESMRVQADKHAAAAASASTSNSTDALSQQQQQQQQQRNWVDVHVLDTWATRCGLLAEGDVVELQHFGVFRPASAATLAVINGSAVTASAANASAAGSKLAGDSKASPQVASRFVNSQSDAVAAHKRALLAATTTDASVQFWLLPDGRAARCPFVLAPVAQSIFTVERGQRLLLHDNTAPTTSTTEESSASRNRVSGSAEYAAHVHHNQSELAMRGGGSRTPQQLFIQSMTHQQQQQMQNQQDGDGIATVSPQVTADQQRNPDGTSSSTAAAAAAAASRAATTTVVDPSLGSGVGKNLFANCFRFVDVMRGLNTHLVPLLKKIQRSCAGVQHILDAGCGSGLISFALKCADPAPEIVATDKSRAMSALVQEKNATFAGLVNRKLLQKSQRQQQQSRAAGGGGGQQSSDAPLVQFVIGDLSASPERFVILPTGGGASNSNGGSGSNSNGNTTAAAAAAVGGRKQFDTIICIDVLAFLPSMEAMKRALFNLVLHAKPHATLLLSVPNLSSCAEDAAKLTSAASITAGAGQQQFVDPEQRPKVQRALHYDYDRHSLSLGCSVQLSHGGKLDVVERQWYEVLTTTSTVGNIRANNSPGASMRSGGSLNRSTASSSSGAGTDSDGDGGVNIYDSGADGGAPRTNLTRDDGVRKVLRRHTEWFGFSCPNPKANNNESVAGGVDGVTASSAAAAAPTAVSGSAPQIFYEQMEELILHPTVLESMFQDMGWHVEEVWLFNALERGGECASPQVNTMAVLGATPPMGSKTAGAAAAAAAMAGEQKNLESTFTHRLYTLSRKA